VASSYDWSATHARRRGGAALERYQSGDWPSGSVIRRLHGSAAEARSDALPSSTKAVDHAGLASSSAMTQLPPDQRAT
jgi:hypothetical protein